MFVTGGPVLTRSAVGTVVDGRYHLVRLLSDAGISTVYDAMNLQTQKHVALKMLRAPVTDEGGEQRRLLARVRAIAGIRHPNVVEVFDAFLDGDSVWTVMELLHGAPVAAFEQYRTLSFSELVKLLVPAMQGVAAAHARGVVHGNLSPHKIFLAHRRGFPGTVTKVLGFGLPPMHTASDAYAVTNKVEYVSYEELRGDRVDARADVYAFGVMLYEGLAGRLPYRGGTIGEYAVALATDAPVPPHQIRPDVPLSLSRVIMRAIDRDRDGRIPTIQRLLDELAPFTGISSELAPSTVVNRYSSEAADTPDATEAADTPGALMQPRPAPLLLSLEREWPGRALRLVEYQHKERERKRSRRNLQFLGAVAVMVGAAVAIRLTRPNADVSLHRPPPAATMQNAGRPPLSSAGACTSGEESCSPLSQSPSSRAREHGIEPSVFGELKSHGVDEPSIGPVTMSAPVDTSPPTIKSVGPDARRDDRDSTPHPVGVAPTVATLPSVGRPGPIHAQRAGVGGTEPERETPPSAWAAPRTVSSVAAAAGALAALLAAYVVAMPPVQGARRLRFLPPLRKGSIVRWLRSIEGRSGLDVLARRLAATLVLLMLWLRSSTSAENLTPAAQSPVLRGLYLSVAVLFALDGAAVLWRLWRGTYGTSSLEVAEIARRLSDARGRDGRGIGQGRT